MIKNIFSGPGGSTSTPQEAATGTSVTEYPHPAQAAQRAQVTAVLTIHTSAAVIFPIQPTAAIIYPI